MVELVEKWLKIAVKCVEQTIFFVVCFVCKSVSWLLLFGTSAKKSQLRMIDSGKSFWFKQRVEFRGGGAPQLARGLRDPAPRRRRNAFGGSDDLPRQFGLHQES